LKNSGALHGVPDFSWCREGRIFADFSQIFCSLAFFVRLPRARARFSSRPQRQRLRVKMLNDRENILSALREKPLKAYEVMKRANITNQEACQSLLLKMRDEGLVKFDIHKGNWLIG
jgi:hypothetical protein